MFFNVNKRESPLNMKYKLRGTSNQYPCVLTNNLLSSIVIFLSDFRPRKRTVIWKRNLFSHPADRIIELGFSFVNFFFFYLMLFCDVVFVLYTYIFSSSSSSFRFYKQSARVRFRCKEEFNIYLSRKFLYKCKHLQKVLVKSCDR